MARTLESILDEVKEEVIKTTLSALNNREALNKAHEGDSIPGDPAWLQATENNERLKAFVSGLLATISFQPRYNHMLSMHAVCIALEVGRRLERSERGNDTPPTAHTTPKHSLEGAYYEAKTHMESSRINAQQTIPDPLLESILHSTHMGRIMHAVAEAIADGEDPGKIISNSIAFSFLWGHYYRTPASKGVIQ